MDNQSINQTVKPCESTFVSSSLSWRRLLRSLFTLVGSRLSSRPTVHAFKVVATGLLALSKAASNSWTLVGLGLIWMVAPLVGAAYQVFDRGAHWFTDMYYIDDKGAIHDGWFHVNGFYYFSYFSSHLMLLVALTGLFIIFIQRTKAAYFISFFAAYLVADILWKTIAASNEEFRSTVNWIFLVVGVEIVAFWFIALEWLLSLHFHKREGLRARIDGTIDINDRGLLDDSDAMAILRQQRKAFKELTKQN